MPSGLSLEEKLMFYTNANTRVAILCNHQRGISNDHDQQMQRLHTKKAIEEESLALLRKVWGYLEITAFAACLDVVGGSDVPQLQCAKTKAAHRMSMEWSALGASMFVRMPHADASMVHRREKLVNAKSCRQWWSDSGSKINPRRKLARLRPK
eukprot:SAG31_NODE_2309_length_5961_cov_3.697373_4_plen_153_part_00